MRKLLVAPITASILALGAAPALADSTTPVQTAPTGLITCTFAYEGALSTNPNNPTPSFQIGPATGRVVVDASGAVAYSLYDGIATENYAFCVLI